MIIALDIETKRGLRAQPDNFLLGCIVTQDKQKHTFHTPDAMLSWILSKGEALNKYNKKLYVYAAHHQFDFLLYMQLNHPQLVQVSKKQFLYHVMETPEMFKQRCETMKKHNKPIPKEQRAYITFMDLFSIYNSSIRSTTAAGLKRVGQLIGKPKMETPDELMLESLNPEETAKLKFTQPQIDQIEQYCLNDTEIIIDALDMVKMKLNQENIKIQILYTIHQIAMNRLLMKLRQNNSAMLEQDARKRYCFPKPKYPCIVSYSGELHTRFSRGGMVQAFQQGLFPETYKIDCNGFWQYVLSTMTIPDLNSEYRIDEPLKYMQPQDLFTKTGYSFVMLKCPVQDYGFLPVRVKLNGQLYSMLPANESIIIGHYTHAELAYALTLGYEVIHIEYSVLWEDMQQNDFKPIIHETYNLRKQAKSEFDDWFYKQMGNSFVGKFNQCFPETKLLNIPIEEVTKYKDQGYSVIGTHDRFYTVQKVLGIRHRPYFAPILYATITANSRIQLHKTIMKFGPGKVLYTDTDSLILHNVTYNEIIDKVNISSKLGDWKFENKSNESGRPIKEPSQIWKEKYYEFSDQVHMSGVSLKDTQFRTKTSVKRKRLITPNMASDPSEIGLMKEEEIMLDYKEKPERKVYIDEYAEDSERMNELLMGMFRPYMDSCNIGETWNLSTNSNITPETE